MPHVLHLVGNPDNRAALEIIAAQAADPANRVTVVLMHAAVDLPDPLPRDVYRLDDATPHEHSTHGSITHSRLLDLVFDADTVVTW